MAKKGFKIEDKSTNLGGLNSIFSPQVVEGEKVEVVEEKGSEQNTKKEKDWYPQTFNVYKKDYIFFQRYSRHMALKNDEKYNLMRCFNDVMNLLREKYPDIEP